jgi:hypothetical protein
MHELVVAACQNVECFNKPISNIFNFLKKYKLVKNEEFDQKRR